MIKEDHPMKKSLYTTGYVAFVLGWTESGIDIPDICRKMGINEQTFYWWKKKYVGMGLAEVGD